MNRSHQVLWLAAAVLASACESITTNSNVVATHIAFTMQPATATASMQSLGNVAVAVLAADGSVAAKASGNITIAIAGTDGSVHLSGVTTQAIVGGVASFSNLAVDKAGTGYHLVATSANLDDGLSAAFAVTVGAASTFRFDTVGTAGFYASAGASSPIVVSVVDAGGNVVTNATTAITVAATRLGSFGTTFAEDGMFGTPTQAAVNGKATFTDLTFHKTGTYQLTAIGPGLTPVNTPSAFLVQNATMTALKFVTQPTGAQVGVALPMFAVMQVDAFSNGMSIPPGPTYGTTITLGANPGGATLAGTSSLSSPGAVAQAYTNISLDKPGTGYTLVATSGAMTITSAPFNITP